MVLRRVGVVMKDTPLDGGGIYAAWRGFFRAAIKNAKSKPGNCAAWRHSVQAVATQAQKGRARKQGMMSPKPARCRRSSTAA